MLQNCNFKLEIQNYLNQKIEKKILHKSTIVVKLHIFV